jgi:uncharacterized surface protein with fasciclin (FAS1) repeats
MNDFRKDIKMKNQIIIAAVALLGYGSSVALACSSCGCSGQAQACESHQKSAVDIVHTAEHAGQFKTLLAALRAADLVDALKSPGPYTVFAPTDKAFAALPAGTVESLLLPENKARLQSILKYHVVAGEVMSKDILKYRDAKTLQGNKVRLTLMINGASVIKADIKSSNGVIHVIDQVILPNNFKPARGYANKRSAEPVDKDILQTAEATGKFKTLIAAVRAAGLSDDLGGKGPFTVFAPTDKAFAELPPGTVANLLKPENKAKLQAILKYHVLPGNLSSHDIVRLHTVKTLNGQAIYPSVRPDSSSIKMKNIYCRNGVIHVIDSVMLPGEKAKT